MDCPRCCPTIQKSWKVLSCHHSYAYGGAWTTWTLDCSQYDGFLRWYRKCLYGNHTLQTGDYSSVSCVLLLLFHVSRPNLAYECRHICANCPKRQNQWLLSQAEERAGGAGADVCQPSFPSDDRAGSDQERKKQGQAWLHQVIVSCTLWPYLGRSLVSTYKRRDGLQYLIIQSKIYHQHFGSIFFLVMSKSLSTYTKSTFVSHEGCWSTIHPSEALSVMLHPCTMNIARITNAALCKKCIKDAHCTCCQVVIPEKNRKKSPLVLCFRTVTKRKW